MCVKHWGKNSYNLTHYFGVFFFGDILLMFLANHFCWVEVAWQLGKQTYVPVGKPRQSPLFA